MRTLIRRYSGNANCDSCSTEMNCADSRDIHVASSLVMLALNDTELGLVTPAQAGAQEKKEFIFDWFPALDRTEGRLCAGMTGLLEVPKKFSRRS